MRASDRTPRASSTRSRLEARRGNREAALAAVRRALELVPTEQREELRSDMRDNAALAALRDEL